MGEKRVVLGHVSGLFGVHGWIKVFSYTRPPANLLQYNRWFLRTNEQGCQESWRPFCVEAAKPHGKTLIAQLSTGTGELVDDRDAAAALLDMNIAVAREDMPPLPPGEFYWHDLVGLKVVNRQHETLGEVTGMMETGANDVLVVRGDKERLIPFVMGAIVDEVDVATGVVMVDWGLDY